MQYNGWHKKHYEVIAEFMMYLNQRTERFVLKGGTSLMLCYGLPRFSEDIDLDGLDDNIEEMVSGFCSHIKANYRVAKDTKTVKRFLIHYGGTKPLKIEVSYRNRAIDYARETNIINGIRVYKIDRILTMKLNAYSSRDKLRDLYDIVFIGNLLGAALSDDLYYLLKDTLSYKGLQQFDFLIKYQSDDLINNAELAENFLVLWDSLGLK